MFEGVLHLCPCLFAVARGLIDTSLAAEAGVSGRPAKEFLRGALGRLGLVRDLLADTHIDRGLPSERVVRMRGRAITVAVVAAPAQFCVVWVTYPHWAAVKLGDLPTRGGKNAAQAHLGRRNAEVRQTPAADNHQRDQRMFQLAGPRRGQIRAVLRRTTPSSPRRASVRC